MCAGDEREPDHDVLLGVWSGGPGLPPARHQDHRQRGIQVRLLFAGVVTQVEARIILNLGNSVFFFVVFWLAGGRR